jgi:hypothetical protein
MNTKKLIVSALFGFIINVASAGNTASIGYTSDYFYRGAQKAEESVQASVGLEKALGSFAGSFSASTNQAVNSAVDSYQIDAGLSKSFMDGLLNAYVGLHHFEDVAGEALSEIALAFSYDSVLNPSVSIYRNTDDDLYTLEVGISHDFDLEFADLELQASAGNTELTSASDRDYYIVGASLSKGFGDSELGLSVDYVDADDAEEEFVFGSALTFKF